MCSLVTQKYDRPKNPTKIRQAIKEKEAQLADLIDTQLTTTITLLKTFQSEVKHRFTQMLLSNVEQIEKCQNSLIKRSKRGHNQSQGLEAATEKGRIREIVGSAKQIDGQFAEMSEMMNRYDEVKKACQVKREEYVRHAERGAEELRVGVENQIDILSEFLDLSRFKKVKQES